jgi:predicted methyltransferase
MRPITRATIWRLTFLLAGIGALIAGCASLTGKTNVPDYGAIVASPDRSDADRKTDQRRKPAELLAFSGVKTGMKVLDVGAGGGYSSELVARAVGPTGTVYAQNNQQMIDNFIKTAFDDRVKKGAMNNVVKSVREFDELAPPEAKNFDLITMYLIYHDTTYMNVDRVKMDRRLFELLKPGGYLVIIDHSAKAGADPSVGKSLHRIDEALLKREVEAAGFKLVEQSDFLRNPTDPRDAPFFKMQTPTDQFALKFVKP